MDVEDETTAYLKYLSDAVPQNYLLQGNEEGGLNDTIPVEPIFTEIDTASVWPAAEGFPILLNGIPLIAEDNVVDDNIDANNAAAINIRLINSDLKLNPNNIIKNEDNSADDNNVNNSQQLAPTAYFSTAAATSVKNINVGTSSSSSNNNNRLYLSTNDNDDDENDSSHNDVCITYTTTTATTSSSSSSAEFGADGDEICERSEIDLNLLENLQKHQRNNELNNNNNAGDRGDTIQLINVDGTVTTIHKQLFNTLQMTNNVCCDDDDDDDQDHVDDDDDEVNDISKTIDQLFSEVKMMKCKLCSYLCETMDECKMHLHSEHSNLILTTMPRNNDVKPQIINVKIIDSRNSTNTGYKIQQQSILHSNNKNNHNNKIKINNNNHNKKNKMTMYICSECKYGYRNRDELREHMITVHRLVYIVDPSINPDTDDDDDDDDDATAVEVVKQLQKNENDVLPSSKSVLTSTKLLKAQQRAMRKVKCTIRGCAVKLPNVESKLQHESYHVNEEKRKFMCPVCDLKFAIWRIFNMHLWKRHNIDIGLLTCPMCSKYKSNSVAAVVNHMLSHKEEHPFMCSFCGKAYKRFTDLKHHSVVHKTLDESTSGPYYYNNKDTQCKFCERTFSNLKCLKIHIRFVHDKFKPFICNICGYETARKAMLQLHYRQHTGDKPHKCTYCDYKTADHNCLRKHIMRHVGGTKYSCPHCKYQCIQSAAYKVHLTTKHPGMEGTFNCPHCTYTTVNAASYFSHVKCHQLDKMKTTSNDDNDVKSGIIKDEEMNNDDNEQVGSKPNKENHLLIDVEDDEIIQNGLLNNYSQRDLEEAPIDTGGITIPAGFEIQLVSS